MVTILYLKTNEDRMRIPWSLLNPIESIFLQLEEDKEFANEGGEIIEDSQLMRLGYDNVLTTG